MTPETEQQYKNQIAALQAEIEKLKNQQTKAIKREKYGLNWIDVPEEFDEKSKNSIPVLKEIKEKAIKNTDGKPTHILIEGDNYHALTCLNYTHAGKIDVIYIDPPYNTGSDGFTYKDARFLTEFPNGKTVSKDDPLRHSTWLSFMEKRLRLAKNLLSDKGVIFISIDDNEQANLKLLCDQIFGEKNFVANFPWRKRTAKSDVPFGVSQDFEWILCFSRNNKFRASIEGGNRKYYETPDFPGRPWRIHDMTKQTTAAERPNSYFTMINPKNGKEYPCDPNRTWRITKDTFSKYYDADEIVFPGDYDFLKISKPVARYFKDNDMKKAGENFGRIAVSTKFPDTVGMSQDGTKEIKDLFNQITFAFPKNTNLLGYILNFSSSPNSTILDFFAGSGTTLHATMKLNAEDGGNRQCILVQQQENDSNICETITYERNRRVMQGYTNAKGEEIAGLGNSLKYYKTDFIGKNKPEKATDEDRISLAQKAGYLISLVENTLEEIETNDFYQIFSDAEENLFTAIYFNGDTEKFPDFVQSIQEKNKKTIVYIFTWGSPDIFENEFDDLTNITIKSIPQPILEIYKSLMKNEE